MSKIFICESSEISGNSFHPNYYHNERINIIKNLKDTYRENLIKLKYLVEFSSQKTTANNVQTYIGMANIESNTGIYVKTEDEKGQGDCSVFNRGDVLFGKLRPYLNKVYYAEFDGGCSTEFIVFSSIDSEKISNKFLSIFLLLDCVVNQTKYLMSGNTLPRLQTFDIENLLIPIPPKQIQQQIINIMDNAYKIKKQKEQEAKEILDSTDKYLLDELGIVMPLKSNNILENRIFMRSFSDISNTRFDPNYHQKYYQDLEKALQCSSYPLVNLASTIEGFRKGIEVGSSEYSQSQEIPFIRVSDISNSGIDFDNVQKFISASLYENLKIFQPQENELLYSKDGTIGICLEADTSRDYVISGGILRLKLTQEVNRYFLQFLLTSSMMNILANRQSIGTVIKHLNIDKFLNLKIPLPSLTEQKRIADEIRKRQEKAKTLQQEAKAILESAKKEVESMILGG